MSTELERAVDCAVSTLAAFVYPSDTEMRHTAILACRIAGFDYLETVASFMESTSASADAARWRVAEACRLRVLQLYNAGATPRIGVGANGLHINGLGLANTSSEETS